MANLHDSNGLKRWSPPITAMADISDSHACCIFAYFFTVITCPSLTDHSHTSIIYLRDNTTPPFPYGTRANYTINCPEGMERDGGDDVRTCTADENSAVGVWSGTAPTCTGMHFLHINYYINRCILTAQKVYLSHGNTHYYANNTAIIISSIMTTDDTSLTCHTDSTTCCRGVDNEISSGGNGEWMFSNGNEITENSVTGSGFYWSRHFKVLRLYRQGDIQTPLGTYCCRIPDSSGEMRTFCANLVG